MRILIVLIISVFANSKESVISLVKKSKIWYGKGRYDFKYSPAIMRESVPIPFLTNYDAGIRKEKEHCRQSAQKDAMNEFEKEYRYPGEQYKQNYEAVWKEVEDEKTEMLEIGEEYGKYKTRLNEDVLIVDDVDDELLDVLRNSNPFKRWYFKEGVITGSGQRCKVNHVAVRISDSKIYYLKSEIDKISGRD